jgi:hypothetical protein
MQPELKKIAKMHWLLTYTIGYPCCMLLSLLFAASDVAFFKCGTSEFKFFSSSRVRILLI